MGVVERAFFFLSFSTVESFSINKEFLVGVHMGFSIWLFWGFQSWSSVSFFILFLVTGPTFSRIQGGTFDFVHSFLFPELVHISLLDPYVECL